MPRATHRIDPGLLDRVLGYLNYSTGRTDTKFLRGINDLFFLVASGANREVDKPVWRAVKEVLVSRLSEVGGRVAGFERVEQADAVLRLVFDHLLPAYRTHHRDLLFHQADENLYRPFLVGRACEAVLAEGRPWEEADRVVRGALVRLNDFLGHRPLAVLEGKDRIEPYAHERIRPIPLWIEGVGAEAGRYRELIEATIALLGQAPPELLRQAWFDLGLLEELAVDPRAYDFDHPLSRRPNHQFGMWDPGRIDQRGHYRRYVVQEITLDGIAERISRRTDLPHEEVVFEAAAVLAGTILMGSGVCGDGPGAHDSSTTLAELLPHIAAYRDAFYEDLLGRVSGRHAQRLAAEAARLHQPFGDARQHLNQLLARRRASQLQHVHLARLFARMGHAEAAAAQSRIVPVASARMQCEIQCQLTAAHRAIDRGRLEEAADLVARSEDLLHRAIECGALVDPWNILGFGAQFSYFPTMADSCHDERVDDLLELMENLFAAHTRLQKEAAAAGMTTLEERLSDGLRRLADWWDQFATTEVSAVEGISGREAWESARHVAASLGAWHQAGTAAGDVAFWRGHVERLTSPKAYALVVEALLGQRDCVAAMALLMQWLSQADAIPLAEGPYSFHPLALRWMAELWRPVESGNPPGGLVPADRWGLTRKFMDYIEAGSEALWRVPRLDLSGSTPAGRTDQPEQELEVEVDEDERDGLYRAAYENVSYRDTTDDGFEGEIFEQALDATDFELAAEARRIGQHLAFLGLVARLWSMAATSSTAVPAADRPEVLATWHGQAAATCRGLVGLLEAVERYPIPPPDVAGQSLVEFDRRQSVKKMLLDRIILVTTETTAAARRILLAGEQPVQNDPDKPWEAPALRTLRAMGRGDLGAVAAEWPTLLEALGREMLLYVPVSRGGAARRVVAARCLHDVLGELLAGLPRLGLLTETGDLLETIRKMERRRAGEANVSEFDLLFSTAYRAVVRCVLAAAGPRANPATLVEVIEEVSEPLVRLWLAHGRRLRLSPLEAVSDEDSWLDLKQLIQDYGHDLFTQSFMTPGNLRGILIEGPSAFLETLVQQGDDCRLVDDLGGPLDRQEAESLLGIVVESVMEHYEEYLDYNSSTTQSDRGEMLYTLLDFLRLLASYERMSWHLQPLVWAHDELLRAGQSEAANRWRERFVQQTAPHAEQYLKRYDELVRAYAMQLQSVRDRLGERFVRPLEVDRLRGLVEPAIEQARRDQPPAAMDALVAELDRFAEEPTGGGFAAPAWLEALEDEVDRCEDTRFAEEAIAAREESVPEIRLSLAEARRRVQRWASRGRGET